MTRAAVIFGLLILCQSPSALAQDAPYQLGLGLKVTDGFTLGGYFSTEFIINDDQSEMILDDVAVLAYGSLNERFSYLVELESIDAVEMDFNNGTTKTNFPPTIERLYGDYKFSDFLSVRFGKQITPIGYWNLQPINVLRETSSNPRYSREMFPKFLSGVDLYGYTPFDNSLSYHVYLQGSKDIDEDNINIETRNHVGFSLEKRLGRNWQIGGSTGKFTETDDTRTNYYQLNSRYDGSRYSIFSEAIFNQQDIPGRGTVESKAFYLQSEYHFSAKHALITRAEYFNEEKFDLQDKIAVIGYSYRPRYPISLKVEYQWHTDSRDNQLVSSFSVLF